MLSNFNDFLKYFPVFIWFYFLGSSDPYAPPTEETPEEEVEGETEAPATYEGGSYLNPVSGNLLLTFTI